MRTKWFKNVSNITELKAKYRQLAREWHPDAAGRDTNKEMAEINKEYEHLFTILPKTKQEEGASAFDGWREAVINIINLDEITIELVGSWIWVSGNTYKHRQTLKDNGYFWASKKKLWYWRAKEDSRKGNRKTYNMDEIRNMHGSQVLASNGKKKQFAIG